MVSIKGWHGDNSSKTALQISQNSLKVNSFTTQTKELDLLVALVSISVNLEITEHTVLKAIYDTRVTFDHTRNVMKGCCVKVWKPVYWNISNGDVSQENLLKLGRDVVPLQQVCKGSIAVITTIVRIVWTNREKFSYSGISTIYSQIRGQWKGRFADTITEYLLYDFEILA